MDGYYKDRTPTEVPWLGKEIYDDLRWFFSSENAEVNREGLGIMSNRIAWINAYVNLADRNYMTYEHPTNWKRGCSFWGAIRKEDWLAMSAASALKWCEEKAKEILHLNKGED